MHSFFSLPGLMNFFVLSMKVDITMRLNKSSLVQHSEIALEGQKNKVLFVVTKVKRRAKNRNQISLPSETNIFFKTKRFSYTTKEPSIMLKSPVAGRSTANQSKCNTKGLVLFL